VNKPKAESGEGQQEGTEEDKTNMVPVANFKSNKLSHIDKR
jgi:hypothetical protein